MEEFKEAVIIAAENWYREVLRLEEKELAPHEQNLLEAVAKWRGLVNPADRLPLPPKMPKFERFPVDTNRNTVRYSDIPTRPSPPYLELDWDYIKKESK